jgi:hypothetical protein
MGRFIKALALVVSAGLVASAAQSATTAAPSNTKLPTISGTARDGSILRAGTGAWTGSPTSYTYLWERCDSSAGECGSIPGATSRRYTVSSADVGHRLRVQVSATNASGSGSATSRPTGVVAATASAPQVTSLPALAGAPLLGVALVASPGGWSGTQPISFDYSWQRCDGSGNNCSTFLAHSSTTSYTLGAGDLGHRMRIEVTARNRQGSKSVFSNPTGVVAAANAAVDVSSVSLPDRLVIDNVKFSPNPTFSRGEITARFHVSDLHGRAVRGALVYVLGLPYGWVFGSPETATDATGWATIPIHPTRNMPLRRGDLVLFVRARKPGENLLAGVSTRRLVQEGIG